MITIFTDGSCWPNPGPGGWSAIVVDCETDTEVMRLTGCDGDEKDAPTTNQRMGLTAAVAAIRYAESHSETELTIIADCKWMIDSATRKNKINAHEDLWRQLEAFVNPLIGEPKVRVTWRYCRGHGRDPQQDPWATKWNAVAENAAERARIDNPATFRLNKEQQEAGQKQTAQKEQEMADEETVAGTVEDLKRSGLDETDVRAMRLIAATPANMAICGFHDQSAAAQRLGPDCRGYIVPYFGINGEKTRDLRLRFLDNQQPKYMQPKDSEPAAYLPQNAATRWSRVFSAKPIVEFIYITEGEKKAWAACKAGLLTIGIGGVNSYKAKGSELLPIFTKLPKGSRVRIIFDSDGYEFANSGISWGMFDLGAKLSLLGIEVQVGLCEPGISGEKRGVDDVLVAEGIEGILNLEWQPFKDPRTSIVAMNRRLRYVRKLHAVLDIESDDAIAGHDDFCSDFKSKVVVSTRRLPIYVDKEGIETGPTSVVAVQGDSEHHPREVTDIIVSKAGNAWWDSVHRREVKDIEFSPYADRTVLRGQAEHRHLGHLPEAPQYDLNEFNPALANGNYNLWHAGPELPLDAISLARYAADWQEFAWPVLEHCFKPEKLNYILGWWRRPLIVIPGVKLIHMVLAYGPPGTGKTLSGRLLGAAYQRRYLLPDLSSEQLFRKFNSIFTKVQFALIEELAAPAEHPGDLEGKLKTMITREMVMLELKGIDPTFIRDVCNYYASTNHPENISVPYRDRRIIAAHVTDELDPEQGLKSFLWATGRPAGKGKQAADAQPQPELVLRSYNAMRALAVISDNVDNFYDAAKNPPLDEDKEALLFSGLKGIEQWIAAFISKRQNQIEDPVMLKLGGCQASGYDLWTARELADMYNTKSPRPQYQVEPRAVMAALRKTEAFETPKLRTEDDNSPVYIIAHHAEFGVVKGKMRPDAWNGELRDRIKGLMTLRKVNQQKQRERDTANMQGAIAEQVARFARDGIPKRQCE